MTHDNLQSVLDATDSVVELLRNAPAGPNVYPGVPAEYTNWRDEVWAWQHTCVLFNLSYHMADLAKFIDWPSAVYSMHPFDAVLAGDEVIGVSTWFGYSVNEAKMLTLAVLDADHAEPGTEVTLLWGEPDGGSAKPTVERHVQREIRAVVSPVPYVEAVRKNYAPGSWRTTAV